MARLRMSFLVGLIFVGCASPTELGMEGTWGGSEASLVLWADGGRLAYPCGAGTVAAGWRVTADGKFTATGDHFFGGGPVPETGRTPHPAIYTGVLSSDRLTLSVVVDGEWSLGPFEMHRGAPEVIERCL